MNARKLTGSLVLALAAMAAPVRAAGGSPAKVTGWIVDEWCQAANANPGGRHCSLDCHKKGAALVLYEPESRKVYHLDAQNKAAKNVGRVTVTGTLDGDRLAVESIEPAPEAR